MSDSVFHRDGYAEQMAKQLLKPGPLDTGLQSGVFLTGIRRIGKTTFIRQDLMPALIKHGALPLYVDLWADRARAPTALLTDAVRGALKDLEHPGSGLLSQLKRVKGLDIGGAGFKFAFQLDALGTEGGATLDQAFAELIQQFKGDVVLIIDEVQQALTSKDGEDMMHALKAARDRVNTAPDMPGKLLIIGTGSHRSLVTEMTARRSQAFAGAHTSSFEPLGKDFVEWFFHRVSAGHFVVPSLDVGFAGFKRMGHRPEELTKAVRQLQDEVKQGAKADEVFPVICNALGNAAADVDIRAIEDAGQLATLVFDRIAGGQSRRLFSADSLAAFSQEVGSEVTSNDVNQAIDKLVTGNHIMRVGHGEFVVSDPLLQGTWQAQKALQHQLLEGESPSNGDDSQAQEVPRN